LVRTKYERENTQSHYEQFAGFGWIVYKLVQPEYNRQIRHKNLADQWHYCVSDLWDELGGVSQIDISGDPQKAEKGCVQLPRDHQNPLPTGGFKPVWNWKFGQKKYWAKLGHRRRSEPELQARSSTAKKNKDHSDRD
jgi:hypothetical protein